VAIAAFDKSTTKFSDGGLQRTDIEFDWPLLGGGLKLSAKALIALLRSAPRATARRVTGILDDTVRAFFKDVGNVGYRKALAKAHGRAAQALKDFKGQLAEAAARRTLERAGYTYMPAKYGANNGIDGVFVKFLPNGAVKDIVIVESKFKGGIPGFQSVRVLSKTENGHQLSRPWFDKIMKEIEKRGDPASKATRKLLLDNINKIRLKVNVLDPNGINRWNRAKLPEWID